MFDRILGLILIVVSVASIWKKEIAPFALGMLFMIGVLMVIFKTDPFPTKKEGKKILFKTLNTIGMANLSDKEEQTLESK